jgi:hypothetical protein
VRHRLGRGRQAQKVRVQGLQLTGSSWSVVQLRTTRCTMEHAACIAVLNAPNLQRNTDA